MRLELTTYSMANATWVRCKSLLHNALCRKSLVVKKPSKLAGDGSRGQDMTLALHPLHPLQALQGRNIIPASPPQLPA